MTQKVSSASIEGLETSKLTGAAMPAIDGSALTNLNSGILKSTTNPAIDSNPSGGVGTLWVNKITGQIYNCTDATTDNNVWKNIGSGTTNIQNGGDLYVWGQDTLGTLGNGTPNEAVTSPQKLPGDDRWIFIPKSGMALESMMGIRGDNTLWAWGNGTVGVLGQLTHADNKSSPVQVGTDTDWASVTLGNGHIHGIKTNGTLWTWGSGSNTGKAGMGVVDDINRSSPTQIGSGTNWNKVAAGNGASVATKTDGTLWGWGDGREWMNGLGSTTDTGTPTQIGTDTDWVFPQMGVEGGACTKTDGTIYFWGYGANGRNANGSTSNHQYPTQSPYLNNVSTFSLGGGQGFVIKTDGTLWAWGYNNNGTLGTGDAENVSVPVQIGTGTWTDIACIGSSMGTVAVKSDGTLWGWGRNFHGSVGDGTFTVRSSPVQIDSGTNWISCGGSDESHFAISQ